MQLSWASVAHWNVRIAHKSQGNLKPFTGQRSCRVLGASLVFSNQSHHCEGNWMCSVIGTSGWKSNTQGKLGSDWHTQSTYWWAASHISPSFFHTNPLSGRFWTLGSLCFSWWYFGYTQVCGIQLILPNLPNTSSIMQQLQLLSITPIGSLWRPLSTRPSSFLRTRFLVIEKSKNSKQINKRCIYFNSAPFYFLTCHISASESLSCFSAFFQWYLQTLLPVSALITCIFR